MYEITLLLQCLLCIIVCHYWFVTKRFPFYNFVTFYILFHIVCFVVRPLLVYSFSFEGRWNYMRITRDETEQMLALMVSSLGLLMFILGYSWARRNWPSPSAPVFNVTITRHDWYAFVLTTIILMPLALYSASLQLEGIDFGKTGVGISVVQDFASGVTTLSETTGYIVSAHNFLLALVLGLLVISRFSLGSFLIVAAFVTYRAYVGWSRWAAVILLVAILIAWLIHKKRRWPGIVGVTIGAVSLIGFQAIGFDRQFLRRALGETVSYGGAPKTGRSLIESLDNADFANFEYLVYVIRAVPDLSRTYTYFTQYLQLITEPIPRMFWEGKPLGAPVQLVNLMDYGYFWGLTTSLVGDGWLSLGWVGVVVTLFLAGALSAYIQHKLTRGEPGLYRYLVFCISIAISIQWYRDGGISIFKFILFSCAPIVLWYGFSSLLNLKLGGTSRRLGFSRVRHRRLLRATNTDGSEG